MVTHLVTKLVAAAAAAVTVVGAGTVCGAHRPTRKAPAAVVCRARAETVGERVRVDSECVQHGVVVYHREWELGR